MSWPATGSGRSLEIRGDADPRGMAVHDRTRLIGRLPILDVGGPAALRAARSPAPVLKIRLFIPDWYNQRKLKKLL